MARQNGNQKAILSSNGVIRFASRADFLLELNHLSEGRLYVQSRVQPTLGAVLATKLEIPDTQEIIRLESTVIYASPPYIGLSFNNPQQYEMLRKYLKTENTSPTLAQYSGFPVLNEGQIRFRSAEHLLGLWLSGLQKGGLTVLKQHAAQPIPTQLTLVLGEHRHTGAAKVLSQDGLWAIFQFEDVLPIRRLIQKTVHQWSQAIEALSTSNRRPSSPPRRKPTPLPKVPAQPPATPPAPIKALPSTAIISDTPMKKPAVASVIASSQAPSPATPILDETVIRFSSTEDLIQELQDNLSIGALSVTSEPLPIRQRKQLQIMVGESLLPVNLEAEVVFAGHNTVGLSVANAAKICDQLEKAITHLIDGPSAAQIVNNTASLSTDLPCNGHIAGPPSYPTLVGLGHDRTEDLVQLDDLNSVRLFDYLVDQHFDGSLRLKTPHKDLRIYFHSGNIIYVEQAPFELKTALGRILTANRKISESALINGLEKAKISRHPLGYSLITHGLARKADVIQALRDQTRIRIESMLDEAQSDFHVLPGESPPGQGDLIVTRGLGVLLQYLRHRFDSLNVDGLESVLQPHMHGIVQPTPRLKEALSINGFSPKEARFLQIFADSQFQLSETIRRSPLTRLASLRTLAMALSLGCIESQKSSHGPMPRAVSHPHCPWTRQQRELESRLKLIEEQNHFDILNIHWTTHPLRLKSAYHNVMTEFTPKSPAYDNAPPEILQLLKKCAQKVQTSYDILSDPASRIAYRNKLFDRTDLEYAAQMLVEKGEVEMLRGEYAAALEDLETAQELAPNDQSRHLLTSARQHLR